MRRGQPPIGSEDPHRQRHRRRDAGDDVVLLIHNQRQWGRHTGILTEFPPYAMVFTFRNRKVVRWRIYADQESALEAAGLTDSQE